MCSFEGEGPTKWHNTSCAEGLHHDIWRVQVYLHIYMFLSISS